MKLYKLTDKDGYTRKGEPGETKWGPRINVSLPECVTPQLCSPDVIHAYVSINLALLLNPIHANIDVPKLWECEGDICVQDWGKVGVFSLTMGNALTIPDWYQNTATRFRVQVCFACLCSRHVLDLYESSYSEDNRVRNAITKVEKYLSNPSTYAARAARAAADAARSAAYAAYVPDFSTLADEAIRREAK